MLKDPEVTILGIPPQGREVAPDPDGIRASTDVEDTSDDAEDEYPHETCGRTRSLDSVRKRIRNKELIYLPCKHPNPDY